MRTWTTGEIRIIEENINLSDKKLGAMLGRSMMSVKKCRIRYKLHKHTPGKRAYKLTDAEKAEIRSSKSDVIELAYFYGISINTVYKYKR